MLVLQKSAHGTNRVDLQEHVPKTYGPQRSHGICPDCITNRVKTEMEALGINMDLCNGPQKLDHCLGRRIEPSGLANQEVLG